MVINGLLSITLVIIKILLLLFLTVCYHATYAIQSESTLYSRLNVKELVSRNMRDIWSLSNSSGIQTQNQLVCEQTLNHLTKLAKWLSYVVNTYMYGAFDCMLLSCHARDSEWIYTLKLHECQVIWSYLKLHLANYRV